VVVERNFNNLDSKMKFLLLQSEVARRTTENSLAAFRDRYLAPAAQACYWRQLFWAWVSVSFEPEFYEEAEVEGIEQEREQRHAVGKICGEPTSRYLMVVRLIKPG
jgi:hypothetical protein